MSLVVRFIWISEFPVNDFNWNEPKSRIFLWLGKSDAPQQTQTFESCSINSCAVCAVQLPPADVQTALELVWNTHFQIVSMQHTTTSNPEWWKRIRAWLLTCSLQGGMIDYASVLESCVTSVQSNWLTPASLLQQPSSQMGDVWIQKSNLITCK